MLDATPHKYNLGLAELTAKPYLYLSSAQNVPFFVTSALLFLEVLKFKERSVVRSYMFKQKLLNQKSRKLLILITTNILYGILP